MENRYIISVDPYIEKGKMHGKAIERLADGTFKYISIIFNKYYPTTLVKADHYVTKKDIKKEVS